MKKKRAVWPVFAACRCYFEVFDLSSILPEGAGVCVFAELEPDWLGLVWPAPEVLAPAEAPPFIMSLNSARLSWPSLFLSALSKSYCAPARLEPAEADEDLSFEALAPVEALPLAPVEVDDDLSLVAALAPVEAAPPEALPLCDIEGFAEVSFCFFASCAWALPKASATSDKLNNKGLIGFIKSP